MNNVIYCLLYQFQNDHSDSVSHGKTISIDTSAFKKLQCDLLDASKSRDDALKQIQLVSISMLFF